MKFYHYPHCPFCQRVRLFLGYKNIPYESVVLKYDDRETPQKLCGSRTLPIMDFGEGEVINESIDILRKLEERFPNPILFVGPIEPKIQWASMVAVGIPRFFDILLPAYLDHYREAEEFQDGVGDWFQKAKEEKRGQTFEALKSQTPEIFAHDILPHLQEIIDAVEDEYFVMGPTFSVADCVLAADLSGLRLLKNTKVPPEIIHYVERVERKCRVDLLAF